MMHALPCVAVCEGIHMVLVDCWWCSIAHKRHDSCAADSVTGPELKHVRQHDRNKMYRVAVMHGCMVATC